MTYPGQLGSFRRTDSIYEEIALLYAEDISLFYDDITFLLIETKFGV